MFFKFRFIVFFSFISFIFSCNIDKEPPQTPLVPSGQTIGYVDSSYIFYSSAINPDGDNISICFYWGDGTSNWSSLEQIIT